MISDGPGANYPTLDFEWDTKTGNNGDIVHLSITRVAKASMGGTQFVISSSDDPDDPSQGYAWAGFVAN
jgi:hypothetical protein